MAANVNDDALLHVLLQECADDSADMSYIESNATIFLAAVTNTTPRTKHELLGTTRIDNYVQETVPRYSDPLFKAHFRMSRSTFQELLELIGSKAQVNGTVSLKRRTLACIWLLSNQETYRSVADRFGLSKGSLHYFLMNFCRVLTNQNVLGQVISWPSCEREYKSVATGFAVRAGFPNVVGAIDGTYIPILGPSSFRDSYICRKGFPAFHLQGVCDSNLQFLDVFCAFPGSVHDSSVYKNSPLFQKIQNDPLPECYHLIGDSAYGLSTSVMVPFRDNGVLTPEEKHYNSVHSSTRVDIERSFGLLKGRFRRLKFLDMKKVTDIPYVIVSCCVLHNFIVKRESFCDEEIITDDLVSDNIVPAAQENRSACKKRSDIMYML